MFEFLSGILVGFVIAFLYWRSVIIEAIRRTINDIEEAEEESTENRISVTVEQEGDQFYLYRYEDNQFIAQGKNFAEFQKLLPTLKVETLQIMNGGSEAAKALIAASDNKGLLKE